MILYIHGFLSSSQSSKAQHLKRWLDERGRVDEWVCPDLPADPLQAMAILEDIIKNSDQPIKLVGSSLGGFYATCLSQRYQLKTVLINPSTNPAQTLAKRIGTLKSWHSDGEVVFTQKEVDSLQDMRFASIQYVDTILVMVEKGDETIDYQQALAYYSACNQLIFNNGDHGFSRFNHVIELIDSF